ncbi:MAG: membrane protein insertase YidC [Deltaproteobacteria bacterium]|nr:membrane protein insertase YidC [Deltaproteobacteria bacterium]
MEKRTIIAFVLSFLILLIWSYMYAPKKQQPPPKVQPEKPATGVARPAETPGVQVEPLAEGGKPAPSALTPAPESKEKLVTVETPLYKAVFSNAGATLKSFKLKKYHVTADPNSPFVELVHPGQDSRGFLDISFGTRPGQNGSKILYHTNADSLVLGPDSKPQDVVFTATTDEGVSIKKAFRIYPDKYPIELFVTFSNPTEKNMEGTLSVSIENIPASKTKRYYSFTGLSLLLNGKLKEVKQKKLKKEQKAFSGHIGWIAYEESYFITALIPDNPGEGVFSGRSLPSGDLVATYTAPPISLKPQGELSSRFTLYLGPRDLTILKQLGKKLDLAINFGWTDIIAKPLLYVLRFFNQYIHNYGVSIILLTVLIKILFWPLTHKSYKSMKEMQKLQPLMAKIREKYKNNKEQMNKELMGLYKTYKINPMGGCLPMIIQIPVFFALYRILGGSIELRHAPFVLWINDLSAPDRLFHFPFKIPFMSPPYGIPVLTLLMGLSMYIQQKMTPTPGDPTQAKFMMFLPIIFTVMFINFPSGLVLYWLVNNILSIGQQYRIVKRLS